MMTNQYYEVIAPFTLYTKVGYTDSNTYVGASQMLGNIWKQIEAAPGAQLHLLVGGAFYVTDESAWECQVELSEKHPFEKVYLLREQPWPYDALEAIDETEATPRNRVDPLQRKFGLDELHYVAASRYGRGIDWVIPTKAHYRVVLEVDMVDMLSPEDAAKATVDWLTSEDGARGAAFYVTPIDRELDEKATVVIDFQNPKDFT